jgi:hypothetical protein
MAKTLLYLNDAEEQIISNAQKLHKLKYKEDAIKYIINNYKEKLKCQLK